MQWKLTFSPKLRPDDQREILKSPFIKKEPFSKVSIHEMHIPEFVKTLLDSGLEIRIETQAHEITCLPVE